MPELPEVTTTVDGLNRVLPGLKITAVWSDYFLRTTHKGPEGIKNKKYFEKFRNKIVGQKFLKSTRRGKNILLDLSGNTTVLIHMKMTGHLLYGNYGFSKTKNGEIWKAVGDKNLEDPYNQFIHLVFSLSNGKSLAFSDLRKFAKVIFFETPKNGQATHLLPLGPEPFETSLSDFKKQIVKKPNLKIKQALMDQSVIAGIGNIYSDEILWAANVHPQRQIKSLSDKEISAIQKEMKIVLKKSIKMGGDSMSDYRNIHGERGRFQNSHKAYRKTGEKCPKPGCLGKIIRLKIGGRSAHFCEKHQK